MYVQMAFALDRVKAMAPLHPEWSYTEPFQSVLEGDIKALAKFDERDLVQLIMVTHAGMTTGEFSKYRDGLARDRPVGKPAHSLHRGNDANDCENQGWSDRLRSTQAPMPSVGSRSANASRK